jgi:hypothetical protein
MVYTGLKAKGVEVRLGPEVVVNEEDSEDEWSIDIAAADP